MHDLAHNYPLYLPPHNVVNKSGRPMSIFTVLDLQAMIFPFVNAPSPDKPSRLSDVPCIQKQRYAAGIGRLPVEIGLRSHMLQVLGQVVCDDVVMWWQAGKNMNQLISP